MGKDVTLSKDRLEELEYKHEEYRRDAIDALRQIHDEKLYTLRAKTWEQYLKDRWDYSKTYGKYLLDFARFREECKEHGLEYLPNNERQVRPILQAANNAKRNNKPFDPVEAWQITVDKAPRDESGEPTVTPKHIDSTMEYYGQKRAYKKPDKAEVDDLQRKAAAFFEHPLVKRMGGDKFAAKHGELRGYEYGLGWLIDHDEAIRK